MATVNVIYGIHISKYSLVQTLEQDSNNTDHFAQIDKRFKDEIDDAVLRAEQNGNPYTADYIARLRADVEDDAVHCKLDHLRQNPTYGPKFSLYEVWHGSKVQLQDFEYWILGIHCGKTVKSTVPMFDDINFFNGLSQYQRDRLSPESHVEILQDPAFLAELSPDSKRGVIRMYQQCGFTVYDSEITGVNFTKKERFSKLVTKICSEMPEFFGPIFEGVIPEFYTVPEVCTCYIHQ